MWKKKVKDQCWKEQGDEISDTGENCNMRIRVKEEVMEVKDAFRNLAVDLDENGRIVLDAEFNHKSMKIKKCAGVHKSVWKNKNVSL